VPYLHLTAKYIFLIFLFIECSKFKYLLPCRIYTKTFLIKYGFKLAYL